MQKTSDFGVATEKKRLQPDLLEGDLLEVVNSSLLCGTFPKSVKTAVVKPLLKKSDFHYTRVDVKTSC
jgi:hypothetical protein